MLNAASEDISKLQINQYSSLVLQTALKLLAGNEEELLHLIRVLLGGSAGNLLEGKTIRNILRLVEETAYSHLMEAILEFAPETLYNELLSKVFRKPLNVISSLCELRRQALASHAKSQDHMELIWEELGTKFHNSFEMGRSGVAASVLLQLKDSTAMNMSVVRPLLLLYYVLEASKDPSGSRVIESFLNSNISAKQKRKLVAKLRGHFAELLSAPIWFIYS
ncbi:hypothetical protein HAX54_025559 [Datura stramonium]|uniref:Uncharacterized protein n=1 Tax=Datura stramonium TaxID=4076 RepID=A0ABS8S6B8_DATST|nr:hypothetical protein [Datura stramonium]